MPEIKQYDYSRKSWADLQDILRHINPEAAPGNYARLIAEIEKRRPAHEEELRAKLEQEQKDFLALRSQIRPYVGWWQLATALVFLVLFAFLVAGSGLTAKAYVHLGGAILFAAAGLLLLKKRLSGYLLTIANAALSMVDFAGFGIQYFYHGVVSLQVSILSADGGFRFGLFDLSVWPGASIGYAPPGVFYIGVNLVAIAVIVIMWPTREDFMALRSIRGPQLIPSNGPNKGFNRTPERSGPAKPGGPGGGAG